MKSSILSAGLLAVSALLSGCVVAPGPVYPEPPPPRVEVRGYPPVTSYVWIDGYWQWGGERHIWVPGRWAPPHHVPRWSPPRVQPLPPPRHERHQEYREAPRRELQRPAPHFDHDRRPEAPRGEPSEVRPPRDGRDRSATDDRKDKRRDRRGSDDEQRR